MLDMKASPQARVPAKICVNCVHAAGVNILGRVHNELGGAVQKLNVLLQAGRDEPFLTEDLVLTLKMIFKFQTWKTRCKRGGAYVPLFGEACFAWRLREEKS
jgi:hypothetical protein